jgi:hypothetical protein
MRLLGALPPPGGSAARRGTSLRARRSAAPGGEGCATGGVKGGADIGEGLRAERERLGLSLKQAEADTRIRTRYLLALEEERFDDLPGDAYVRGFLRCYATYLGLDGGRYLAAYRARVQSPEPPIALKPVPLRPPRRSAALLLAAGLAAVAAVGFGAWKLDERADEPPATPTPPHPESVHVAPPPQAAPEPAPPPAPAARPARPAVRPTALVLTARGGNCWLDVRIGGPAGRRAWTGTLQQGRTLRLGLDRALFIRAGAPHNLHATIGGEVQPLQTGVFDLVATREGLRPRP